ncbi:hypothetical protein ACQUKL_03345 [Ralstonia pseudosolanacearum]
MSILQPKAQTITATQNAGQAKYNGACGPSNGSILPDVPTTFLCASGSSSPVNISKSGGSTYYNWTCSGNNAGSPFNVTSCRAQDRLYGACGTDNGAALTAPPSNPANMCFTGNPLNLAQSGASYTWNCDGNYGPMAQCSAQVVPPRNCLYDLSGMTDWTNGSYYYVFYTPNVGLLAAYGKTGSNFAVMYEANPFTLADARRVVNSYGYDIGDYVESYGNLQAYKICK